MTKFNSNCVKINAVSHKVDFCLLWKYFGRKIKLLFFSAKKYTLGDCAKHLIFFFEGMYRYYLNLDNWNQISGISWTIVQV